MRKITLIGSLLICFMLIIISVPSIESSSYSSKDDNKNEGIWLVRGSFKYLDEDDEYIYLRTINARLIGIGAGLLSYHLRFPISIKISKPFYGFLPKGSIPLPGFVICRNWDYVEDGIIS